MLNIAGALASVSSAPWTGGRGSTGNMGRVGIAVSRGEVGGQQSACAFLRDQRQQVPPPSGFLSIC